MTRKIPMLVAARLLAAAWLLPAVVLSNRADAQQAGMSPSERAEFEAMIRDYLMEHPEVIVEAMDKYFEERDARVAADAAAALETNRDEIFHDPNSPVAGNAEGDVTIVEYFDYNCSFCRLALPTVLDVLDEDRDVRFVFKEFPIRGTDSSKVANAALAAEKQGKYFEYHVALMSATGPMTLDRAEDIAKDVGLDVKKLRKDMADPIYEERISRNTAIADEMLLDGTPTFIIGTEIIRGWPGEEEFLAAIEKARNGADNVQSDGKIASDGD